MTRFNFLFTLLMLILSSCNYQNELPDSISLLPRETAFWTKTSFKLKYYHVPGVQELIYEDINNDRKQEVFIVSNKYKRTDNVLIRIYDENFEYFNVPLPGRILTPLGFFDTDNDKIKDIFAISINKKFELVLSIINYEGKIFEHFLIETMSDEFDDVGDVELKSIQLISKPSDHNPTLLISLNYSHGLVYAVSLKSHKVIWKLKTNYIADLKIVTIDQKKPQEIFVLCDPIIPAIGNPSLVDENGWLYRLNLDGQNLHPPIRLDGKTSRASMFSNGNLLWLFYSPNKMNATSKIFEYSFKNNKLNMLDETSEMFNGHAVNWAIKSIPDLFAIIGSKASKLLLINKDGKIFHTLKDQKYYKYKAIKTVNLHNDGSTQLILDSDHRGLNILNSDFVSELNFWTGHFYKQLNSDNVEFITTATLPGALGKVYRLSLYPVLISNRMYYIWGISLFIVLCILVISPRIRRFFLTQRKLLSQALDSNPNPIFILSGKGRVSDLNFAFKREFEDLASLPANSSLHSFLQKKKYHQLKSTLAGSLLENTPQEYRINLMVKNAIREFQVVITPLAKGKKPYKMMVELRDISELVKSAQDQLWTKVAREIAHKIKTPLTTIMLAFNNVKKLFGRSEIPGQDKLSMIIENAALEVERIREQSKALMLLARAGDSVLSPLKPDFVMAQVVDNWQSHFQNGITIKYDYPEEIPFIQANEQDLRVIFENILSNSIAAMKSDGTILICIRQEHDFSSSAIENNRVVIEISDDGCGIPKDKIDTIFEAYYTTKQEGTGLGMVILRRLVEIQGGEISVHSREGIGTTITLSLIKSSPNAEKESDETYSDN